MSMCLGVVRVVLRVCEAAIHRLERCHAWLVLVIFLGIISGTTIPQSQTFELVDPQQCLRKLKFSLMMEKLALSGSAAVIGIINDHNKNHPCLALTPAYACCFRIASFRKAHRT